VVNIGRKVVDVGNPYQWHAIDGRLLHGSYLKKRVVFVSNRRFNVVGRANEALTRIRAMLVVMDGDIELVCDGSDWSAELD